MAAIMGLIFRKTIFKNNKASFYYGTASIPPSAVKICIKNTWDKTKGFIVKSRYRYSVIERVNMDPSKFFTVTQIRRK